MTKLMFQALQDEIGWSSERLASVLGVSATSIARYRHGHVKIPGPVQFAMRALAAGYRPK